MEDVIAGRARKKRVLKNTRVNQDVKTGERQKKF